MILSTDVGNEIDDQWAIAYLLVNPSFDVLGIVSAHAPSLPAPSAHATYEILKDEVEHHLGMATHPPLFEGSSLPLADIRTPRPNSGADFIVQVSKRFSKDRRLAVLTIGAATDVASAILQDPDIADRIEVVAMGFKNLTDGGQEYNVENDPKAWQVILGSRVPVTIGSGDVCRRDLALSFEAARKLVSGHGPVGAWLWSEYQAWYFRFVKPLRVNDFSKPWVIWDTIVLAYEQGMTTQKIIPRLHLADNLSFEHVKTGETINWITAVDSAAMWSDFLAKLDKYQQTHTIPNWQPVETYLY
ncbi:MAG: nucleoside hydrolase [Acidobacteriaceae bacterium]|nr:nucleoside hydrolase [Acidobacteriaceae bacterium]